MLTLHDLEITRPSNMSSRVSSDLLTAERGVGVPYMGYMSMCHGIALTVFEVLDPYKGYHFCPCLHCVPSVILRQAI